MDHGNLAKLTIMEEMPALILLIMCVLVFHIRGSKRYPRCYMVWLHVYDNFLYADNHIGFASH
jgi:hypothetical protein